jgi:hypothetical protein
LKNLTVPVGMVFSFGIKSAGGANLDGAGL